MTNTKKQEQAVKPAKDQESDYASARKKDKAGTGEGNVTGRPEQGPEVSPEERTLGNP